MNDTTPPDADTLNAELRDLLKADDAVLAAGLKRFDTAVRASVKKDFGPAVIARLAAVAEAEPAPGTVFIRMMTLLDFPPETVLRVLLARRGSREFLAETFVWSLRPDGGENLILTPPMIQGLKGQLESDFASFGAVVWRRAAEQERRQPRWCEAWSGVCRSLLQGVADAPAAVRRQASEAYAGCLAEASTQAARKLTPLLTHLVEETGPLSREAAARVARSPIGTALKAHTADALARAPPPPAGKELEALPMSIRSLLQRFIGDLSQAMPAPAEPLPDLRPERDALAVRVAALEESLAEQAGRLDAARSAADKLVAERDELLARVTALEVSRAALQRDRDAAADQRAAIERRLAAADEDYQRLKHRAEDDLRNLEDHLLRSLYEKIREPWQLAGGLLPKVKAGERTLDQLIGAWNSFDALLAERLRQPGFAAYTEA